MSIRAGDLVTGTDLLHGLLLPSGNDAAQVIARRVGKRLLELEGGKGDPVERFVEAMNHLTSDLGLSRTRFTNPSGLDHIGQYSTAKDLAILASAAFSQPMLRTISSRTNYHLEVDGDFSRSTHLLSTVLILGELNVRCGKTGSTRGAGACLAIQAELHGKQLTLVLLGSKVKFTPGGTVIKETDKRFEDARALLSYVHNLMERVP